MSCGSSVWGSARTPSSTRRRGRSSAGCTRPASRTRSPTPVLLLEHPPVYTAGRRTADSERPLDGTPVVDVDRGGKITWHGPGQLVGYPILKLPRPVDVVAHVRRLEEALIRTCAEFGLETTRVEGRSGVWVLGDPVERAPGARRPVAGLRPPAARRGVRPAAERPGVRAVQRRPAPRGPQARRDRHPRRQGRDDARLRAEREPGQHLVRPDRAVRHPRRGRHLALERAGPRRHRSPRCCRWSRGT